jgi:hypothetical protein
MRRPSRGYLVVVAGLAKAAFAERAEAGDYADTLGAGAQIQIVDWWPAGVWRHGISAGDRPTDRASLPAAVFRAHQAHARATRRCTGAGLDRERTPWGSVRYRCGRCRARIH